MVILSLDLEFANDKKLFSLFLFSTADLKDLKVLLRSIDRSDTLLYLDFSQAICSLALLISLLLCKIGISIQSVGRPVFAHSVEVNAESIPPDTPITKPFDLDILMYSISQLFNFSIIISYFIYKIL